MLERGWTKDVINTAIVDCGIAGRASQIAKLAQDMAVRFAVVFQIVCIKIRLIPCFELKVEITGDENLRRLRSILGPIDQRFSVGSAASSVERIGMSAQDEDRLCGVAWFE